MSDPIVSFDEAAMRGELRELVRRTVEDTLNALLEEEADDLIGADRYERTAGREAYRAGHYERGLTTTSGQVTLRMPKLKGMRFATAIIERYKRRETSVEEAMIEMYLVLPPMYFPPFTPMIHNRSRQPAPAGYANVFPPLSAPPPNLSRNARASRARARSGPGESKSAPNTSMPMHGPASASPGRRAQLVTSQPSSSGNAAVTASSASPSSADSHSSASDTLIAAPSRRPRGPPCCPPGDPSACRTSPLS